MAQYYNYKDKKSYKELDFSCQKCNWSGTGEELWVDMDSSSGFIVLCPKCREYLDFIDVTVSLDELEMYGSEEEKAHARERKAFWKKVFAGQLKTPEQLPEIESDEIIITLREEKKETDKIDAADIVLYWGDKELWREERLFEYYPRYLELGEILKEKYGSRLVDFETEYTVHLGGDSGTAFDKVIKFRKSLSGKEKMSNAEFELITKSGEFSEKKATYWRALDFAKERHEGQTRNEGTPYFSHIEGTIEILRQCGKISDYIFTIAALHDVLEDTDTSKEELYAFLRTYPDDEYIRTMRRVCECDKTAATVYYDVLNNGKCRDIIAEVELLTKSGGSFKEYIDRIFQDDSIKREEYYYNGAKIVKLADRLHNLTTLHLCGKPEKIQRYIRETEEYIMPWRDKNKNCEVLFERIEKRLEELKSMQN
jgi:hypothetical protein